MMPPLWRSSGGRPEDEEIVKEGHRTIVQSGHFNGRRFSIFDDGSIEIETGDGIQRFNNFAELTAAAAAKNGHADPDRMSDSGSSL